MAPLARYGFRPQDAICGGLLSAYAMTGAGARTQGTRQAASRGRPTGRRIQPRREPAGVRPERWARRSGSGAAAWAGAARDSLMASTDSGESRKRPSTFSPVNFPSAIHLERVAGCLPRYFAAADALMPRWGWAGAGSAMESHAAMMRARWAGDRAESVSSTATMAARVAGLIVAGLLFCGVFMLTTFPKGERQCKPKSKSYLHMQSYAT